MPADLVGIAMRDPDPVRGHERDEVHGGFGHDLLGERLEPVRRVRRRKGFADGIRRGDRLGDRTGDPLGLRTGGPLRLQHEQCGDDRGDDHDGGQQHEEDP